MSLAEDVLVLGGGAAGLMCAAVAGRRGRKVRLVEHAERVGKKILMSGGGRCNFTNRHVTPANYLSSNPHFCKSALARYEPADFVALVEKHGIAYHEKELGQLFCDTSSRQIVDLLLDECHDGQVAIEVGTEIGEVTAIDGGFRVATSRGPVEAESLVVATGGLSIPLMGATGFGYDLARRFGHTLVPTRAALVPLTLPEPQRSQFGALAGVSLPARAGSANGKKQFDAGFLLTHRGLSGPSILQISSYWQAGEEIAIDFLPGRDLRGWLRERRRDRPTAELKNLLGELLPKRLAQLFCELPPGEGFENRQIRLFSDAEIEMVAARLAAWKFRPDGSEGWRKAEVTLGGVDTRELSSATMESKKVPGLYFIGEVVDVTGHLGGFNFQWAWASGHAAGEVV